MSCHDGVSPRADLSRTTTSANWSASAGCGLAPISRSTTPHGRNTARSASPGASNQVLRRDGAISVALPQRLRSNARPNSAWASSSRAARAALPRQGRAATPSAGSRSSSSDTAATMGMPRSWVRSSSQLARLDRSRHANRAWSSSSHSPVNRSAGLGQRACRARWRWPPPLDELEECGEPSRWQITMRRTTAGGIFPL